MCLFSTPKRNKMGLEKPKEFPDEIDFRTIILWEFPQYSMVRCTTASPT